MPADLVAQTDEPTAVLRPGQAERASLCEEWHEDDIAIHGEAAGVLFALRQPLCETRDVRRREVSIRNGHNRRVLSWPLRVEQNTVELYYAAGRSGRRTVVTDAKDGPFYKRKGECGCRCKWFTDGHGRHEGIHRSDDFAQLGAILFDRRFPIGLRPETRALSSGLA